MNLAEKHLKLLTQVCLLAIIAVVPFVKIDVLYFPFVSGKAYVFRVLVAVAFFFWVWLMFKKKEYRPDFSGFARSFRKNILVVAIILFFAAQVTSSLFGVDPMYSLFSSIERADGVLQYGFWILYFLMFASVFRKEQDWRVAFFVFIAVAVLLSIYSWINWESQPQLYGIFGNPAYFAAFLLFAIGFSLLALERKLYDFALANYALLLVTAFLLVTLVFTQVRGAYVGFAGGVFLFCLLSVLFLRKEHRKLALVSGAVLLLGFLSVGALFAAKDTAFVQHTRLLYRITEVTEFWDSGSVRERILNWNIALKAFQERPLFGYGPENFGSAANKFYDYRIGRGEPWFDRAHNQPLDTLATGGIAVFSFYLFWLAAAGFLIFKISRRKKILSFLIASLFLAYFLQGFFLFDLLAVYLGLFPLLAFLMYEYGKVERGADTAGKQTTNYLPTGGLPQGDKLPTRNYLFLVPVALLSAFVIYTTAVVPYKASAAAIQFYAYSENGFYKESLPFLEKAFSIQSPYTFWDVRKRAGWQFVQVLEYQVTVETEQAKLAELHDIYEFITPELERFIEARPYDPQMYYVLARTYRFGSQQLGRDDLGKAEAVLRKGFEYSDLRTEYFNEFAQVLLLQGKFEEAEQSVKEYASRVNFYEYFPYVTLGHFYFVAGKYEEALAQYEKGREAGYKFYEIAPEYSRYMRVAEEAGEYRKIVDMAKAYLAKWGPDADTYFNVAVGYLNLEEKESAKEFFLKALKLKPEYGEHRSTFFE